LPFFTADLSRTNERRVRIVGGRVQCGRIGLVDLDRCRECDYLRRLERSSSVRSGPGYVVCAAATPDPELDLAW
jgi:hypothetical protein